MLTARNARQDKVDGLRAGADDYLTKPFAFDEAAGQCLGIWLRSRHQGRRCLCPISAKQDRTRRREAVDPDRAQRRI